jgi:hypothetical protein
MDIFTKLRGPHDLLKQSVFILLTHSGGLELNLCGKSLYVNFVNWRTLVHLRVM